MRTTVRLNDELLVAAKQRAAAEHTTLTALIEDSLRRMLAAGVPADAEQFRLRQVGDVTTEPGVNLDDSTALRDRMDGFT